MVDPAPIELPEGFCLSVVIPAWNEESTIGELLHRVAAVPIQKQVLVVDDGSTDETQERVQRFAESEATGSIQLLVHGKNRGKGAALRTGFAHATGNIVIVQDADLEYDPGEYTRLIAPIVRDEADVVYGSRFLGLGVRNQLFWHRVANGMITLWSNLFTNLDLSDVETCYKVLRRDVLSDLPLREDGFGVEVELTAKLARRHRRIYEIPIKYQGRNYSEGKKIRWKDGWWALYCVPRYWWKD